jgi:peptidoglycan/LPS O-acetylase OafA/YrhL
VHFFEPYTNSTQDAFGSFAYVAVTIFFMISSYGMSYAVDRKKDYIKCFFRNRLSSLLIPCILINCFIFLFRSSVSCGWADLQILYHINDYVLVLLQYCLFFYVVQCCKKKWFPSNTMLSDAILLIGVSLSSLILYFFAYKDISSNAGWCFERMGLVWGILLYRYYDRLVLWMSRSWIIKIIGLIFVGLILGLLYLKLKTVFFWGEYLLKIILGLSLILLCFILTSKYRFDNKINRWLGNISYEVYLLHGFVITTLPLYCSDLRSEWFIFFTFVIALILGSIFHSIAKPITNLFRR